MGGVQEVEGEEELTKKSKEPDNATCRVLLECRICCLNVSF